MEDRLKEIAARVRELREIEGVSAESLARSLGVDSATYTLWESGQADFPVGILIEIAARFTVDLSELISGSAPKLRTYCLTRAEHGQDVNRRAPYSYRSLAPNFIHKKAEPFLVEVSPKPEGTTLDLNSHPGQEFNYVIEGRLLISVGTHELELNEGDSLYFDSGESHGMKALDGKRARFIAIVL